VSSGKRKAESVDTKLQKKNYTVNTGSKSKKQITEEFGIAPTTLRTIWTNKDNILEARDCGDLSSKRKKNLVHVKQKKEYQTSRGIQITQLL
jgi:hypothetical protein